jgi:hypothetical protein
LGKKANKKAAAPLLIRKSEAAAGILYDLQAAAITG